MLSLNNPCRVLGMPGCGWDRLGLSSNPGQLPLLLTAASLVPSISSGGEQGPQPVSKNKN